MIDDDKPPLDLSVDVVTSTGTHFRWAADDPSTENRPAGLHFSTRRGEGFADSGMSLPRKIDVEYDDLSLLDDVKFFSDDSTTAYEGRVAGLPRSLADVESIGVDAVGHMANSRDRMFREIYIDRDMSRWYSPTPGRTFTVVAAANDLEGMETVSDSSDGGAAIRLQLHGPWTRPHYAEAWYDAGPGLTLGGVYYSLRQNANISLSDNNWSLWGYSAAKDGETGNNFIQEISDRITGSGSFTGNDQYTAFSTPQRYFMWELGYSVAAGGGGLDYSLFIRDAAIYGNHGLTRRGTGPGGFFASDVMRNIVERFCPSLNVTPRSVTDTTYPIPHLVFWEPTHPYDAFLEINKYHLWEFAVWEDKTFWYYPSDLTKFDWDVRLDDPGVQIDLQGDTTDTLVNGIVVTYTDVDTGATVRLLPDSFPQLKDTSSDNPANTHNIAIWTEIQLSTPTTQEGALGAGAAALVERNMLTSPGTIKITGWARDYAGNWQQGWKVRATQTIAITDHPNPSPRFISETTWDQDSLVLTLTLDQSSNRVEAILDRIAAAIFAANLG